MRKGRGSAESLLSFPEDSAFVTATLAVLPWEDCGAHDTARKVIPSIFIEKLFKKAPVNNPKVLARHQFITKSLADRCRGCDRRWRFS